jgi:hypothetical protein
MLRLLGSLFLGFGILLVAFPIFFYWFIHGDRDRYVWIIQGPAPFNQFGSGPFQLSIILISLLLGVISLYISWVIYKKELIS